MWSVPAAPTESTRSDNTDLEEGKEEEREVTDSPATITTTTSTTPITPATPTKRITVASDHDSSGQEPWTLAGAPDSPRQTEPSTFASATSHPSIPENPHRDSMASHVSETREIKTMAKMWDEEDRMTKDKARRTSVPTTQAGAVANVTSLMSGSSHSQPSSGASATARRTASQEKLRSTFLSTGLKPGAYPDHGPCESDRALVSRQYGTQFSANMDDSKTATNMDEEEGGGAYNNNGPHLVEAFVVHDPEDNSHVLTPHESTNQIAHPPIKSGTAPMMLVEGDEVQKPSKIMEAEPVRMADLLLHRNMLMLIGALVCCFVIAAVIVVAVVMTVVVGGSDGSSTSALSTSNTGSDVGVVVPSLSPTLGPTILILPDLNGTMSPTVDASDGDEPAEEITETPSEPPSEAPSETPTFSPTAEVTSEPSQEPSLTPTMKATPEPTQDPTPAPTPEPTMRVTQAPTPTPTIKATPKPTQETTPAPTPKPTMRVTQAPTPTGPTSSSGQTVRVAFTVWYAVRNANTFNPSQSEQDALDDAMVNLFANALDQDSNSALDLESKRVSSTEQKLTGTEWQQDAVVEFTFKNGLPSPQTIVGAFDDNVDPLDFLKNVVIPIGPSFATSNAIRFSYEIEEYEV